MCLSTDLVWKVETQCIKWVSCLYAGVAKLADAQDLKSCGLYGPCGFDSHPRHFVFTSGMACGTGSGDWLHRVRDEECLSFIKMAGV